MAKRARKTSEYFDECAEFLEKNANEIIARWLHRARREVIAAATTREHLALEDHLPHILNDIRSTIQCLEAGVNVRAVSKNEFNKKYSQAHGRERAELRNYSVDQVLHEYSIFRQVITDFLYQNDYADEATFEAINRVIEFSSQNAVDLINQSPPFIEPAKLISIAKKNINIAMTMLEELMDAVTIKTGKDFTFKYSAGDFYQLVNRVCEAARLSYPNDIIFNSSDEKVEGTFDVAAVRRLLENLLSNAVKYGAVGEPILVNLQVKGDEVVLSVHNKGPAIAKENLDRIFQTFQSSATRTVNGPRSWGVGLSLVRQFAAAHGGDIKVESSLQEGTTFTVTLKRKTTGPEISP